MSAGDHSTKQVRVRVAPSPTGDPHVGTAYVTLFNYAFAKKNGGKLILRIEDTDRTRARESSETAIFDSLKWLGLEWDEGPDKGGDFGPYRQSERRDIHQKYARQLRDENKAYPCFCTQERLDELRAKQRASGETFGYDGHCRDLDGAEVARLEADQMPSVLRLKVPRAGSSKFHDVIRGEIEIQHCQVDDQILLKSDGYPTYHLANVVDDHLMEISHVIRAEEWISSTPKHVLLYQAFSWPLPSFSHVSLLRNSDKSKISKRKNPVSLNYYRRKGILPQALVNYLGLMGWSYGQDIELFSLAQMIEKFNLEDMHAGGPVFDMPKLLDINQHYIQKMSSDDFTKYLKEEVFNDDFLTSLYPLMIDRLECFEQLLEKADFFFTGALNYEGLDLVPKKKTAAELRHMLKDLLEVLDDQDCWEASSLEVVLREHREKLAWKPRDYLMPLRLIATGRKDSPPLPESLEVIGREMVRFRIRESLKCQQLKG